MVQQSDSSVRTKRVFSEEFRVDAVRLVTGEGYSIAAAAKSVGGAAESAEVACSIGSQGSSVRRGRFGRGVAHRGRSAAARTAASRAGA